MDWRQEEQIVGGCEELDMVFGQEDSLEIDWMELTLVARWKRINLISGGGKWYLCGGKGHGRW